MNNIELIKKHLPENLREIAGKHKIPEKFFIENSDLIILVLESRSMDTYEEKQSWFNLYPLMKNEQIEKLRGILTKEKTKLKEIEDKYEQKKKEIKNKYEKRRETMGYENKMKKIKEKENINRQKELQEADNLLENL